MDLVDLTHGVAFAIAKTNGHPDPEAYATEAVANLPEEQPAPADKADEPKKGA